MVKKKKDQRSGLTAALAETFSLDIEQSKVNTQNSFFISLNAVCYFVLHSTV
jgi:hypothetical protein